MAAATPALGVFLCEDDDRLRHHLVRMLRQSPDIEVVGDAATAEEVAEVLSAPEHGVQVLLLDLELPGMDGLELLGHLRPPPDGPDVLILTTYADADRVFEAMKRGAAGYLVKGVAQKRIVGAIREVAAGGTVIEPRLARRFWNLFQASRGGAPVSTGSAQVFAGSSPVSAGSSPVSAGGSPSGGSSPVSGGSSPVSPGDSAASPHGAAGAGNALGGPDAAPPPRLTEDEVAVLELVARGLTNPEVGEVLGTSRRRVKSRLEAIYRKLGVSGRVEAVIRATSAGWIRL